MKKMRLHIIILLLVFIITFIIGTFIDYDLNSLLFSNKNTFGLIVSIIGMLPGYMMFGIFGGMFLGIMIHKKPSILFSIALCGACLVFVLFGTYYWGREFFGKNGFDIEDKMWIGYIIAFITMIGCAYFGFILEKNTDNPKLFLLIVILCVAIFMSLIAGTTVIKNVFHRPRFRMLQGIEMSPYSFRPEYVKFYNWYEPCKDYKNWMEFYNISKEEFKSFPSGHCATAAVFILVINFLPLLNKKYKKLQLPLFYAGFAWLLLVCFVRMLVGAHFLSDVSMGSIITLLMLLIANEVVMRLPQFKYINEEEQKE